MRDQHRLPQHGLIAALALAGERAEAIRQYETYASLLESEGLEPVAAMRELVERLRSERRRSRAGAADIAETALKPLTCSVCGESSSLRWRLAL